MSRAATSQAWRSEPDADGSDRLSPVPRGKAVSVWWAVPFVLAAIEIGSFVTTQTRVADQSDWHEAGRFVRDAFDRDRDVVLTAPGWTRPVAYAALGDVVRVSGAGLSDLASYERVWALSTRGHDPAELDPTRRPALERWFGRVRVRRWDLGPTTVRYGFVDHLREAEVRLVTDSAERDCPWRRTGFPYGGGVLQGPMTPSERFVCPSHPWLWVGRTVQEDLDLETRDCIWQHPQGNQPVRAIFRDVPLGERLVFYGGIYHGHEHAKEGGPVVAEVRVDGRKRGRFVHQDGDGWNRLEFETRSLDAARRDPDARGTITVDVTAPNPHLRTFCWSATIRVGSRDGAQGPVNEDGG